MSRYTVGLTGGVASGKSLAAGFFTELGVPVLDADQAARDVVQPGSPALARIAQEFGPGYLLADGSMDRQAMREAVFKDSSMRKRLEAITHPGIRSAMAAWRDAQTAAYCILSAAILLESGMDRLVQRLLVVDAPESEQGRRLALRDGSSPELARRMLQAQMSREERLARADDVLRNDGDPTHLRSQVQALHAVYLRLASTAGLGQNTRGLPTNRNQ